MSRRVEEKHFLEGLVTVKHKVTQTQDTTDRQVET